MAEITEHFARAYGKPFEVGQQIGSALADEIRQLLQLHSIPDRFSSAEHKSYLERILNNIRQAAPELVEEMEGLAEGAQVPAEHIFMLNCLVELASHQCTVFAFADAAGGPLVGKTNDLNPNEISAYAVLVIDIPGQAQLLSATWPGTVWGTMCVNEHGVAIAGASVGTAERNDDGVPSNMAARIVLSQARSVDDVIDRLAEVEIICHPFNWIVADEKRALVVERSVYKMAVRQPEDGLLRATNHYLSADLAELVTRTPEQLENSRQRYEKIGHLAGQGEHNQEKALQILTDHTPPAPICRHGGDPDAAFTTAACILRPRARVMWFAAGQPCKNKLRPYQLQMPVVGGGGMVEIAPGEAEAES